ncbi:hypothetical protein PHISCL_04386 [Aspergillus sclerotialis]|uniref:Uncharacterized protein n=1 Tax=Aspergillus sclerotialis TaxID=2070753 RepID=A0A3A3A1R6_9EURO|nr:hypothetical protein PHISCL_04386 [Aspergillus sclerotialis]
MSNDRSTSPISVPPSSAHQRRGSLSGLSFADFLSKSGNQRGTTSSQSSFITNAAANAQSSQQRRLSITTLGLSGSPTQSSPFGARAFRRGSLSSSMGSNAEEAVTEENENTSPQATPSSPFARRVSFGAHALRDARGGSLGNGRYPSSASSMTGPRRSASVASPSTTYNPTRSPPASSSKFVTQSERSDLSWRHPGEGFNWSEALRTRAERAPSISNGSPSASQSVGAGHGHHQRSSSIASTERPTREIPNRAKQNKPDFFQEKILRGDFMD